MKVLPPVTVIKPVPVLIQCPDAPPLAKVIWLPIKWELATNKDGLKVVGLSSDGYTNLSKNTAKALERLKQDILVIKYYKDCIAKHNKSVVE